MKRAATIFLVLFVLTVLTGCTSPYSFSESVDEIVSVELVSAESSLEFTVIKTLSDTGKSDFLELFQSIQFTRYIGDPPEVRGEAIKITYQSGNYEMICSFASEFVKDGVIQFRWMSCDKEFARLLDCFSA